MAASPRKNGKAEEAETLLEVEGIDVFYDRVQVLYGINVVVRRGERIALLGTNGAGKSTLLKGIMGQLRPLGGSINLNGVRVHDVAYLPQQNDIDRDFPISVFDCVAMGLWHDIGIWRSVATVTVIGFWVVNPWKAAAVHHPI